MLRQHGQMTDINTTGFYFTLVDLRVATAIRRYAIIDFSIRLSCFIVCVCDYVCVQARESRGTAVPMEQVLSNGGTGSKDRWPNSRCHQMTKL